jgi:endonuclease/exonuclease/phosphatase family metal-dependent hydrolase
VFPLGILLICTIWVAPLGFARNDRSPEVAVRVLSWNPQNYRDPLTASPDGEEHFKSNRSIRAVVRRIVESRPRILTLCEVAGPKHLRALQGRLADEQLELPHAHSVAGPDEARQLAILSAFPIIAQNSRGWIPFEMRGRPLYMGRGILDVTVKLPGDRSLRLVGVHLKSRRPDALNADLIRRWEAFLLRQHLENHAPAQSSENLPVLVWGDFNDTVNSVVVREITGSPRTPGYLEPIRLVDEQDTSWTHFYKAADLYSRIDYFLVSRALEPWVDEAGSQVVNDPNWEEASDHRPLLLQLRIGGE